VPPRRAGGGYWRRRYDSEAGEVESGVENNDIKSETPDAQKEVHGFFRSKAEKPLARGLEPPLPSRALSVPSTRQRLKNESKSVLFGCNNPNWTGLPAVSATTREMRDCRLQAYSPWGENARGKYDLKFD
jgi:hypothetical protein